MTAIRFDTLDYANKLKSVGFTEKQAEVQAHGLASIINNNLCTKEDLLVTKNELKDDIHKLRNELKDDIHKLETRLILWIIAIAFSQAGLVFALLNFFLKH